MLAIYCVPETVLVPKNKTDVLPAMLSGTFYLTDGG